ncbi:uncharacterized protein [Henckelia pumila]|uniref:uncharacterized protein n=1 Tax=Henckelia pumila TaxID=405737 RepID=UPI003C6E5A6B
MVHRLSILVGARPIKQKKRHFGPEKDKVIKKEVDELLRAGHIREVQFPTWLSNVVLFHKSSGHQYLCFMYAYQGHHQIPLAEEDQDKIGRNVEVYVDDILVKSQDDEGLTTDLKETFAMLRSYGINLNPEKFVFGKVQRLAGRIAALSRFISRSAHRSLSFFRVLRRAKKFEWDAECRKAFKDLKNYLAELPVLAKAVPGEPLYIYLSALEGAVSSVLIRQEGTVQYPIYFFSHALNGVELRYSEVEKLALALVMTARKLRPYFLSHPIVVLTNSPMEMILTHVDISGRLVKWTTELSEYDIQYEPRAAIKAQALADFLAETKHMEEQGLWKVYVDGSSNSDGCGVGVLLISPHGDEIRLVVRLDFLASNNEAEYEAVLIGLRAAKQVGEARVHLYSDSQLVAQQVNGTYEVKNEKLKEYMRAIEEAWGLFDEVMFEQIPRECNEKADSLANMASSLHN